MNSRYVVRLSLDVKGGAQGERGSETDPAH